jgi:choline dehydrogenase-like flavoprotein
LPICCGVSRILDGASTDDLNTALAGFLPTSRGTVTLGGPRAEDDPVIDPNYLATEADRFVFRTGLRQLLDMLGAPSGKEIIESETPPDGVAHLEPGKQIIDDELDARIRMGARYVYDPSS